MDFLNNCKLRANGTISYKHIRNAGLCGALTVFSEDDSIDFYSDAEHMDSISGIFNHFDPTIDDEIELINSNKTITYWGANSSSHKLGLLTDLRLTIILFCAAINNEL